jgi:putative tricarboxylic transport membrane protein
LKGEGMFFARFSDAILGVVLCVGSLVMILIIIPISVQVPKSNKVLALSPDFWIKIIVWLSLCLGAYLLFTGLKSAKAQLSEEKILDIKHQKTLHHSYSRSITMATIAVINFFLYFLLIDWIGMVLASIIAVIAFVLMCGERRYKIMFPVAVILPVGLYYFFLKVANIPMPLGVFS